MSTEKDSKKEGKIQRPRITWSRFFYIVSKALLVLVLLIVIFSVILVPLLSVLQ